MNVFSYFKSVIQEIVEELQRLGELPAGLPGDAISVEPPRDPSHGDLAANAALVLAKAAKRKPRDIAGLIAPRLEARDEVVAAEIAGPGFINVRLSVDFWHERLRDVLRVGRDYGTSTLGGGEAVNVEYVSANPTGPLHVGHCRGAVFGDALAALLEKAGYAVTREYYINDAGAQVDDLARSAHLRYREALGETVGAIPEGLYPGDYLVPLGKALAERDGKKWLDLPESDWLAPVRRFAIDAMMALIRDDLAALGIHQEVFTSERALQAEGKIEHALENLASKGLVYKGVLEPPKGMKPEDWEPRQQTLFKATEFGDDVDRPIRKSDQSWTYFAGDLANHLDKYERGFDDMINVWGADHGGYVKRMKAGVAALSGREAKLDIKLCQMVNLLERGKPVKMSKRAGTFVTLRDVVDQVGKDVVRFIMLTRKNDAQLDFDFARVTERSRENPVFYVQYAHARARSVFRNVARDMPAVARQPDALAEVPLDRLASADELALIKTLVSWPRVVESAAQAHEPHRVAFYLHDLASEFHGLWNKGNEDPSLRFIREDDAGLTAARLALVEGVASVIASGLGIMGVEPVEEMR